ncbi:MAG: hypothetical protein F4X66_11935 [Chloroflexi bacterium]|nr:hypothetical protein [Chloroflexota bacterium]
MTQKARWLLQKTMQIAKRIGNRISLDSVAIPLATAGTITGIWLTGAIESRFQLIALTVLTVMVTIIVVTMAATEEKRNLKERLSRPLGWTWGIATLVCIPMVLQIVQKLQPTMEVVAALFALAIAALVAIFLGPRYKKSPITAVGAVIMTIPLGVAWASWAIQTSTYTEIVAVFLVVPTFTVLPLVAASSTIIYGIHRKATDWQHHRIRGPLSETILMASVFIPGIVLGMLLQQEFGLSEHWRNTFALVTGLLASGVISEPLRRLMRELANLN